MAKWIVDWYDDTVTCSECGAREDAFVTRSSYGGEWAVDGNSIYCPTCGARMTDRVEVEPIWWNEPDDEEDCICESDEAYDFPCAHCIYGNPNGKESGDNSRCYRCFLGSEYRAGKPMGGDVEGVER